MGDRSGLPTLRVEALRELVEGGAAPFKRGRRSYILRCPRPGCGKQKLYVDRSTGLSKCFRCGGRARLANWALAEVYGKSASELGELLYGVAPTQLGVTELPVIANPWEEELLLEEEAETPEYPQPLARDPMWVDIADPAAAAGAEYLEKRGVPLSVAVDYRVGWSPPEQRVLFPVVVGGQLLGWQGRYIHATEQLRQDGKLVHIPKAKTVGQLGGKCLMFQDRLDGAEHAVLVEGPVDALKCHLMGGNVASMGKDVSRRQLDIILGYGVKRLYVGLDRDAATVVGRLVRELVDVVELFRLLPPQHRDDLGDCTMDEVAEQYRVAERMTPAHAHQVFVEMPKLWS